MKQCAVLFVNPQGNESPHPRRLRDRGFIVHEVADWPAADGAARDYHVILVHVAAMRYAPMIAARLRAKPHFGRRLLIALVDAATPQQERRSAEAAGFDDVMSDSCDTRQLATRIRRRLRSRPELRCVLPPALRRRLAA